MTETNPAAKTLCLENTNLPTIIIYYYYYYHHHYYYYYYHYYFPTIPLCLYVTHIIILRQTDVLLSERTNF
jgi:hypothetical protein